MSPLEFAEFLANASLPTRGKSRGAAVESPHSPSSVADPASQIFDDVVYEECPICEGEGEDCVWCDGLGLVEHSCEDCA